MDIASRDDCYHHGAVVFCNLSIVAKPYHGAILDFLFSTTNFFPLIADFTNNFSLGSAWTAGEERLNNFFLRQCMDKTANQGVRSKVARIIDGKHRSIGESMESYHKHGAIHGSPVTEQ